MGSDFGSGPGSGGSGLGGPGSGPSPSAWRMPSRKAFRRAGLAGLAAIVLAGLGSCAMRAWRVSQAPPAAKFCTRPAVFDPLPFLEHRTIFYWIGYDGPFKKSSWETMSDEEFARQREAYDRERNVRLYYEPIDRTLFPEAPAYARMLRASPDFLDDGYIVNVALQGGYGYTSRPPSDFVGAPPRPAGAVGDWVMRYSRPTEEQTDCRLQDYYIAALKFVADTPADQRYRYGFGQPEYSRFIRAFLEGNGQVRKLGATVQRSWEIMTAQRARGQCLQAEWIRWEDMPLKAYRLSWIDKSVAPGLVYGHSPRYVFYGKRLVFFEEAVIRGAAEHEGIRGDFLTDSCCTSGPPINKCSVHGSDDPFNLMGRDYDHLRINGEWK